MLSLQWLRKSEGGFLGQTAFNLGYTLGMTEIRREEEINHMATYTRYWIMFVVALMAPFSAVSDDGIQDNNFFLDADIMYSYVNGISGFLQNMFYLLRNQN